MIDSSDYALWSFEAEQTAERAVGLESAAITTDQRSRIRSLFGQLGISSAQEQFAIVREITGQAISRVDQLTRDNAQVLIYSLPSLIRSSTAAKTGNAWDDREGDTWIDRL